MHDKWIKSYTKKQNIKLSQISIKNIIKFLILININIFDNIWWILLLFVYKNNIEH